MSEPISWNIQKSIAPWLVCWSKPSKRTITKERRATIQPWRRHPRPHTFNRFPSWGSLRHKAPLSYINHKIRVAPCPKFDNSIFFPSCIERWRLSITKEINTVSNATYSTLHKNRPLLTKQLCFLKGFSSRILNLQDLVINYNKSCAYFFALLLPVF